MAEDEDNWFYESIERYNKLNMFELEYPVHHVMLTNSNSICVSCSNNKHHQLLELALPMKLTLQETESSQVLITSDNDLKIKCGTFTQSKAAHVRANKDDRTVIVSHENIHGVVLYRLSSDGSDQITIESRKECELESPFLALNDTQLVLTKNTKCPILLVDSKTSESIGKVQFDQQHNICVEPVSPSYLNSTVIALCHHISGQVKLYDNRDSKLFNAVNASTQNDNASWSFSSLFESSEKQADNIQSTYFATISNGGFLTVYDSRNWSAPWTSKDLGLKCPDTSQVNLTFKPFNHSWLSVSGFDGNVYVYNLASESQLVFVHDGHRHVEGFTPETVTTSHAWFQNHDSIIISSADNGTVQAWQFEEEKTILRT